MMDERSIIQRLFERDEAALAEVEQQYASHCLKAAERILGDEESAKECWKDLLLDVWNRIPPFEPRSLKAFLLQRIRQIAISRVRKETAKKRGGGELTLALEELEEVAGRDNPADALERKELNEAIGVFVKALPEQERTLFLLRYWQLEKPEAIAQRLNLAAGTVNTRLHRIRKSLKEFLKKEGLTE